MLGFYPKLLKKSMPLAVFGLFLFFASSAHAMQPNDPFYYKQAPMWKQINAESAWDAATGTASVTVAVIDIGTDIKHPDLAENIWVNPNEIPDNGIDDDNNGFIDDINGWNFIENNNNVIASESRKLDDPEAIAHGTVIAGLLGAVGGNGIDGTGLNWKIKIMPIRAIENSGSGSYENIIKAVNYAVQNGASIIGMSFVGEVNDENLRQALLRAYNRGVLVVIAAGNGRLYDLGDTGANPYYPLCYDQGGPDNWLLGVTSVDGSDHLSDFANYGACVDIAAPGDGIYSTMPGVAGMENAGAFGGPWEGTSFSVPLVAGTAALIESLRPEYGAKDLIQAILSTADDIDGVNPGLTGQIGYGRLNAGKAIAKIAGSGFMITDARPIIYFNKSRLSSYYIRQERNMFIGNLSGRIIAVDSRDLNGDGEDEIAALILYKSGYRVNIISSRGDILNDFALATGKNYNNIKLSASASAPVVLSAQNRNNTTGFSYSDLKGESAGIIFVPFPAAAWAVGADGNLTVARKISSGTAIYQFDNRGKQIYELTVKNTSIGGDIRISHILDADNEQAAAILRSGNTDYVYIFDLSSRSYVRTPLPPSALKRSFSLLDYNGDNLSDLLVYNLAGGSFDVYSGKGAVLGQIILPPLSN